MKTVSKKIIWFLVAIVVCALTIVIVPAANGLTPQGVRMLGVFISTIILWLTVNDRFTVLCYSLVGYMALVGMPYKDVLATSVINDSAVICFLALLLAESLNETGAMDYLAKWLLSRKIVEGHPYIFILFIMIASIVLAILTATGMGIVFIYAFAVQLLKTAKIDSKNPIFMGTMLGILWTYCFGEMMIPYKCVSAQFVLGLGAGLGYPITNGQFMSLGVPFAVVTVLLSLLLIRLFFHPKKEDFSNYEVAAMQAELKANPLSRSAKIALGCVVLAFVLLLVQSFTFIPFVAQYFVPFGSLVCYLVPIILLAVIHCDGKPVMNVSLALRKISWEMVFFMANIMLFATTISKPDFGVTVCLQNILMSIVGNVSPLALFAIAIIFVGVLTNITSNYALASLGATIFAPLLAAKGLSPQITIVAIGEVAFFAFLTPAGGLGPAVIFGSGEVSIKKAFVPSAVMLMMLIVMIIGVGYVAAM